MTIQFQIDSFHALIKDGFIKKNKQKELFVIITELKTLNENIENEGKRFN